MLIQRRKKKRKRVMVKQALTDPKLESSKKAGMHFQPKYAWLGRRCLLEQESMHLLCDPC